MRGNFGYFSAYWFIFFCIEKHNIQKADELYILEIFFQIIQPCFQLFVVLFQSFYTFCFGVKLF